MVKTVLIVDDNATIRCALRELFNRVTGFKVCGEAENGREAIQKAEALHPDLIVLDFSMPVMNGLEAARILRQMTPSTPLMFYSLYLDESAEEEARSVGISAVVSKNENVMVLIDKARSLVHRGAA
jgi:DNA-binding NarL/FixJ family response regulator